MRAPITTLAFFAAVLLLASLAFYKLVVWVVSGLALGAS